MAEHGVGRQFASEAQGSLEMFKPTCICTHPSRLGPTDGLIRSSSEDVDSPSLCGPPPFTNVINFGSMSGRLSVAASLTARS